MQSHNTAQPATGGPTDELLLSDVRDGKLDSFGVLYERYVSMARAIAYKHTSNSTLSEDIVSEAFVRVLQALKNGKGPRTFMGGYLATTVAHLAAENGLIAQKEVPSEEEHLESMGSLDEAVLKLHESDELISAFTGLPERWQTVLWITEVEGKKPREVAQTMNLSANAVSALATRARESLREGFLRAHQNAPKTDECAQYSPHLSSMVRGSLTKKRSEALRLHLSVCSYCTSEYLTLAGINKSMRVWVFPVLAGLVPVITDGSKVLLPFLAGGVAGGAATGAGGAAGAGSQGGLFSGFGGGRWTPGSQALAGAAAVVTAIGAVAGGIALVNNSSAGSAVISADFQLQTPKAQPSDDTSGVTDSLVNEPQSVSSGMTAETLRSSVAVNGPLAGQGSNSSSSAASSSSLTHAVAPEAPAGQPLAAATSENVTVSLTGPVSEQLPLAPAPEPSVAPVASEPPATPEAPAVPLQPEAPAEPVTSEDPVEPVAPSEPTPPAEPETPIAPEQPVAPEVPVEPVDPVEPEVPVEPVDPEVPVEPVDPEVPVEPVDPEVPVDPVDPDTGIPEILGPLDWVGTPEYYEFIANTPWDTIGHPVGDNRMCIITFLVADSEGADMPSGFGTYLPPHHY